MQSKKMAKATDKPFFINFAIFEKFLQLEANQLSENYSKIIVMMVK